MIATVKLQRQHIMIELNWIDDKWYVFNEETCEYVLRKDAPKEIQELEKENEEMLNAMQRAFFGDFGKNKQKRNEKNETIWK